MWGQALSCARNVMRHACPALMEQLVKPALIPITERSMQPRTCSELQASFVYVSMGSILQLIMLPARHAIIRANYVLDLLVPNANTAATNTKELLHQVSASALMGTMMVEMPNARSARISALSAQLQATRIAKHVPPLTISQLVSHHVQ